MTTVLIEDYALLRVAIQHVLERVRKTDDILAISPAQMLNLPTRSTVRWKCWWSVAAASPRTISRC